MASGGPNFVPLPFFTEDPNKKNEKGPGGFGGFLSESVNPPVAVADKPPAGPVAVDTTTTITTSKPTGHLPTDFFSSNFSDSSNAISFNIPSVPIPQSAEPAFASAVSEPLKDSLSGPFGQSAFPGPFGTNSSQQPFNAPSAPSAPVAEPSAPSQPAPAAFTSSKPAPAPSTQPAPTHFVPSSQPAPAPFTPAQTAWSAAPSEPNHLSFTAPSQPEKQSNNDFTGFATDFKTPTAVEEKPSVPPWENGDLGFYNATPPHAAALANVSWHPQPLVVERRSSTDSQKAPQAPRPSHLEAIDETVSNRSFTNSSFVIEGGKACDRCGKQNETLANFCCRCGANIASPIESPADSQVFSVDSSMFADQFARFSISEKKPDAPSLPAAPFVSITPSTATMAPAVPVAPASVPASKAPSRIHPVVSLGFGGSFCVTFPTLQTRYNPNGQPINSYRPSLVYHGDVSQLPMAKDNLVGPLTQLNEGAPFLEKSPKDMAHLLAELKAMFAGSEEKYLVAFFELLQQSHGKFMDPKHGELLRGFLQSLPRSHSAVTSIGTSSQSLAELTGRVSEGDLAGASNAACQAGLWSHALVLGQFAGPAQFQRVVAEFARQDLPPCHPLRIAYLVLSGQQSLLEAEFNEGSAALLEHWTQILGILLQKGTALIPLGDALAKLGELLPAQLVYLLSQDDSVFVSGRLSLLGSKGDLRLTELYEAIRSAQSSQFSLPHLFPLKYTLICQLAESGLLGLALRHCNALGQLVKRSQWKDQRFLEALDALANRLDILAEGNPNVVLPSEGNASDGWLPKVGGGLMDALDRGLNRVIGVEDGEAGGAGSPGRKSKSPILPQIDVAAERPAHSATPAHIMHGAHSTYGSHAAPSPYSTPVGGFDPFGKRPSFDFSGGESHGASHHASVQPPPMMFQPGIVVPPSVIKDATEEYIQRHETIPSAAQPAWIPAAPGPAFNPTQLSPQPPVQPMGSPQLNQQSFQPIGLPQVNQHPMQPMGSPQLNQQQAPQHSGSPQFQTQPMQVGFAPLAPGPVHTQAPPQPAAPWSPSGGHQHQVNMPMMSNPGAASMDDFGLGNQRTASPRVDASPANDAQSAMSASAVNLSGGDKDSSDANGSKSSLIGGFLGGLFRRKQNTGSPAPSAASSGAGSGPVKANLGDSEMKLVYDEVRKQWVRKDTGAPPVAEVAAPPPPPSLGTSSAGSLGPSDGSPMSYRRTQTGGARGRYVDAFDGTPAGPSAPVASLIPTPSFTNLSLSDQGPSQHQGQFTPDHQQQTLQHQSWSNEQFTPDHQQQPQQQQWPQPSHQTQNQWNAPPPQQPMQQQYGGGPFSQGGGQQFYGGYQ